MSAQPEALRMAEWLEKHYLFNSYQLDAAAELRRLHTENGMLRGALGLIAYADPRAQLLNPHRAAQIARFAIDKATAEGVAP